MIDDYRTHAEWFYLWDITEAETLAHQWFGNYLTCRDWSQIWLNKGFAHYFSGLYNEHKNGREEFLLYQVFFDQNSFYLNDWNSGIRHPVVTRNYDNAADLTSRQLCHQPRRVGLAHAPQTPGRRQLVESDQALRQVEC